MKPFHLMAIVAATASTMVASAMAGERCYDFSGQTAGTDYAVGTTVPIDIGRVKVRELLSGHNPVADNPANKFLRVMDQKIAGGAAPEMYGKNVAVQIEPFEAVHSISMRLSHQPGIEGGRAALVEVNGQRHDFKGSLAALDGKTLGSGQHVAKFQVDLPPENSGNWDTGRLRVSSNGDLRSFTVGAAELRVDDVCIRR